MATTPASHYARNFVNVTGNKTLTAADSGVVQNVVTDGVTITLPTTALASSFVVRNGAKVDGAVGITIAPNSADGFTGNGYTATVNKAAINTKATSKPGDELSFHGTGATGATGWVIDNVVGTWARQA